MIEWMYIRGEMRNHPYEKYGKINRADQRDIHLIYDLFSAPDPELDNFARRSDELHHLLDRYPR